ncbi:MAG: metalloregulator ArsR/SmtB family transcription factor, partial [Desulfurococcaceae archaeon]
MVSYEGLDQLKDRVIIAGFGAVMEKFSILANPTRKAIIYLLATEGPLTLKEISEKLGLSPSTVSDHLRRLKSIGIITEAKEQ